MEADLGEVIVRFGWFCGEIRRETERGLRYRARWRRRMFRMCLYSRLQPRIKSQTKRFWDQGTVLWRWRKCVVMSWNAQRCLDRAEGSQPPNKAEDKALYEEYI